VAHVDDLQGGDGLGEVDTAAVQAGKLAEAWPVPSRAMTWSHQNSGKQASSWPASSG
jgi:hypothetical protein